MVLVSTRFRELPGNVVLGGVSGNDENGTFPGDSYYTERELGMHASTSGSCNFQRRRVEFPAC